MVRKRDDQERDETGFKDEDFEQSDNGETALALDNSLASELPKATHTGELKIGDAVFQCAVLEDGTRVLTQRTFFKALGRQGRPRKRTPLDVEGLPPFLNAANLEPFISSDLRQSWSPILFRTRKGGVSYGYRAELLPQVCSVYLEADDAGQLQANQRGIVQQCHVLIRGLATVGIVALVDEATGYQEARDRDALHKILEAYIAKELLPWTKRFPDEFYREMFRLRDWQYSPMSTKGPRYAAQLTNEIVYDRLPPGVLDELRRKNPIVGDVGQRRHRHHQFLTEEIGNPHLEKHLAIVTALMRASTSWDKFKRLLARAVPKPNETIQEDLGLNDDEPDDLDSDVLDR